MMSKLLTWDANVSARLRIAEQPGWLRRIAKLFAHSGDSWFWINNLAALVMARVDNVAYNVRIDQILKASTQELLWQGALGSCSEVSSANALQSEGCYNQAWSNASYLELLEERYVTK